MTFNGSPDDIINQFKRQFKSKGPKSFFGPAVVVGIILVIVILSNIFYSIQPDEVGVVLRFGRFVRKTQPGLHLKIPFVEEVTPVRTRHVFTESFGFRAIRPGVRTHYDPRPREDESLMLTGDLNVINLEWIVQFRKDDPYKVLYNIRRPERAVRDISEAVLRQIVGDYTFSEVLTLRRVEINQEAQEKLQHILNEYGAGIEIVTVRLQDVNPPETVKPAFNEVNEARQERESLVNQAWQYYNRQIPEARGEARKRIEKAQGYALGVVNEALGDAERFSLLYEEYAQAKDVTRKRIYLDHLRDILPKAGKKYIVDRDEKGILPILRLGDDAKKF